MSKYKTIAVREETKKRLDALYSGKGDSYEKIIKRLLDEWDWLKTHGVHPVVPTGDKPPAS